MIFDFLVAFFLGECGEGGGKSVFDGCHPLIDTLTPI